MSSVSISSSFVAEILSCWESKSAMSIDINVHEGAGVSIHVSIDIESVSIDMNDLDMCGVYRHTCASRVRVYRH